MIKAIIHRIPGAYDYVPDALDHLPCGISVFDQNLMIVLWNETFVRLIRLPDELLVAGQTNIEDMLRYNAARGEYGAGNVEEIVAKRLEIIRLRLPHVFERTTLDGRTLEIRGSPLPNGGFVTTYVDITERKESERQYRATLDNASIGILFTRDRKTILGNQKAAEMFGYASTEEFVGLPGSAFWPSDEVYREVGQKATPILSNGGVFSIESTLRRKDGSTFLGAFKAKAINARDTSAGTIWIAEDITEKRAAERALNERSEALQSALTELSSVFEELKHAQTELIQSEKLAALGAMVAGVAHELNTPIGNCITAASYLAEEGKKITEALASERLKKSDLDHYLVATTEGVLSIHRTLSRAAELVRSFKQVAIDRTSSKRRSFELGEIVSEVVAILGPSLRRTTHSISVDIPEPVEMDSYPGPLGQVLTNLIDNSIVHGLDGLQNGHIFLSTTVDRSAQTATIQVKDDGAGIPENILPKIFDPFFTTKLGVGGSGLGLSIAYNIVTGALGGTIVVDSKRGKGTVFSVTIPVRAPEIKSTSQSDSLD